MGVSFLGTLLLPNWCQNWGLEPSTGAFTVISLNSVQGVDGAGLLTASQCSLVAPWEAPGCAGCAACGAHRVEVGLLQNPIHPYQLMVLERTAWYCVQCMQFYSEQVAWPAPTDMAADTCLLVTHSAQGRDMQAPCLLLTHCLSSARVGAQETVHCEKPMRLG